MDYPFPVRFLQMLNSRLPYPALTVGFGLCAGMLAIFVLTGVIYPDIELVGIEEPLEITGQFLVFSLVPAFLLACMLVQVRATPGIISSITAILDDQHKAELERWDRSRHWRSGLLAGLIVASALSIPWTVLDFRPASEAFVFSVLLVLAQFVIWSVVGLTLSMSLHNAFVLHRIGKLVKVDIFNLDALNPFGQVSLRYLLIIAGALAITPLQSIDQEFRWENYENPILVGVPAMLLLMLVPIWSVHKQIKTAKHQELSQLNAEINDASRTLDDASLNRLNALMERRKLVTHCRNWPMDFSIFSRVIFYVLIPPLAWAGAAMVELALDTYLAG